MRRSGRCRVCEYRQPVKKDGTVGEHKHWARLGFNSLGPCKGAGEKPIEGTVKATK